MTTQLGSLNSWNFHTISRFNFSKCGMNSYVLRQKRFTNEGVYTLCSRVKPSNATLIGKLWFWDI